MTALFHTCCMIRLNPFPQICLCNESFFSMFVEVRLSFNLVWVRIFIEFCSGFWAKYHNFESAVFCRDPIPASWQLLLPLPPLRCRPSLELVPPPPPPALLPPPPPDVPLPVLLLLLPLLLPLLLLPLPTELGPFRPPPPLPPVPAFMGVAITPPVLAFTCPNAIAMGLGDESGDWVSEDTWRYRQKFVHCYRFYSINLKFQLYATAMTTMKAIKTTKSIIEKKNPDRIAHLRYLNFLLNIHIWICLLVARRDRRWLDVRTHRVAQRLQRQLPLPHHLQLPRAIPFVHGSEFVASTTHSIRSNSCKKTHLQMSMNEFRSRKWFLLKELILFSIS